MLAYLLYFLGFVTYYRLSEDVDYEDKQIPEWYHLVVGLIWPLVVIYGLITDLRELIWGK